MLYLAVNIHSMIPFLKNEKAVIKEIHDSFDNAQEELLKEAESIINSTSNDLLIDKAERLKKLGFTSSIVAKKGSEVRDKLIQSKEDAELVAYYKQNYPLMKFLRESQLDEICGKYNLIYAPVKNYIKDVPEKNLRDIENAQSLKENDEVGNIEKLKIHKDNSFVSGDIDIYNLAVKKGIEVDYPESIFRISRPMLSELRYKGGPLPFSTRFSTMDFSLENCDKSGLFIAAPKSHFNTSGLTKKGKFGFMNVTVKEVKDPIVFRYCRGGIQVITKWGLEASDEMLLNEIEN